jgi:NADP-dependent 3-hydroxy acid dehydrogenase YdfG
MRRYGELSKAQERLLPHQFCSDCIIATRGYDFREGPVARRLADQGARVLIHGRDRTRSEQLLNEIRAAHRGSAAFLPADFCSLAEVRRLADIVRQKCDRLDILINNAGIGSGGSAGKRETSQDGHELRFAVNYLAGFLLTRVLLPLVMLGKPARIVNVSSLGQHPIDFDDVMLTRGAERRRIRSLPSLISTH